MPHSKAISSVIVIISFTLLAVGLSGSFLVWNVATSENIESAIQQEREQMITKSNAGFEILDINHANKQVLLKNNGKINLETDAFAFYLNGTQVSATPDKTEFGPGETVTFTLSAPGDLYDYDITTSGPYNTRDIIFVGQVTTTTTASSTSSTTSTSTSSSSTTSTTSTSTTSSTTTSTSSTTTTSTSTTTIPTTTTTIPTTTTSTTTTSTSTTTTLPECSFLILDPSSGPASYTVYANVENNLCKVCDYMGCTLDGNCQGNLIRTGSGAFTAPSNIGVFRYWVCPNSTPGLYQDITVMSVCGNGVKEGNEQCDGSDMDGVECTDLGFTGGNLACVNCTFDTSGCTGNNLPFAFDDFASTSGTNPVDIDVPANDTDPDGDLLDLTSVLIYDQPDGGIASVDPVTGVVSYTNDGSTSDPGGDPCGYSCHFIGNCGVSPVHTIRGTLLIDGQPAPDGIQYKFYNPTYDEYPCDRNIMSSPPYYGLYDCSWLNLNGDVLELYVNYSGVWYQARLDDGSLHYDIPCPTSGSGSFEYFNWTISPSMDSFTYTIKDENGAESNQAKATVTIS